MICLACHSVKQRKTEERGRPIVEEPPYATVRWMPTQAARAGEGKDTSPEDSDFPNRSGRPFTSNLDARFRACLRREGIGPRVAEEDGRWALPATLLRPGPT